MFQCLITAVVGQCLNGAEGTQEGARGWLLRSARGTRGNVCPARALRAPGALLLDYVPPEEPPSTPLGNALRIR